MASPLVTVICLCYNHARYVKEAIESVVRQSYPHVQIIVWDDASTDNSPTVITELQKIYPQLEITLSKKNEGNCRAFNRAYAQARGEFIVDFATDDVMHQLRIENQVASFLKADARTGVVFTDATYIDEQGTPIRHHYEYLLRHRLITDVATGDVFRNVLSTYYVASPTMMMRRSVLDAMGGYDEQLAYEDFDLCVRSARTFLYTFLNERLTLIRKVTNSLSTRQYVPGSSHLISTFHVCEKAFRLCRDEGDRQALTKRVRYELRQAVLSDNHPVAEHFWTLLGNLQRRSFRDLFWKGVSDFRLPLSGVRRLYNRMRFGT